VHEFIDRGDVRIGQGHEDGCLANGRLLEPGNCQFINFERDGDSLAVAIVKFLEGQSVLYWLTRADVDTLPLPGLVPPGPPVPPIPDPPVPPEPPMSFPIPPRVKVIVQALYERNLDLAHGNDDQRRALILKCAQQVCFELGAQWGTKKSSAGNPPSKDALAHFDGVTLYGADCFDGTTRKPSVPDAMEPLPGQVFIAVTPLDWLGEPTPPPPPDGDIAALKVKFAKLDAEIREMWPVIKQLNDDAANHGERLHALENKPPPVVLLPKLRVKGSTGRAFGHGHAIDLPVIQE
jgi:hypothetical protein